MTFKWELNFGTVLQIITILFVAFGAARKFGMLETKLNIMYTWFEKTIIGDEDTDYEARNRSERFFGSKKRQQGD